MDKNQSWFEEFKQTENYRKLVKNPIAYFCAEYALTSSIPIYAGGLGILAGDILREASDRNFPLVAIGLYYNDGYQTLHTVNARGYIDAPHTHALPETYGLAPVLDEHKNALTISIPIQDRIVLAKAWRWQAGLTTVYLLDTNVEGNDAEDRKITDHLYVIDKDTRLKQEIVLGIGGHRLLAKLAITPSIYHLNEGHSGLLALEIIHEEMANRKISFAEARGFASRKIVFTNHTLLPSGNEIFSSDLVSLHLASFANAYGIPISDIIMAGKVEGSNDFSLTTFSLWSAGKINAVSQLHAKKAKELWPNYEMLPITNGVHFPNWNFIANEESLWESHLENKKLLIEKVLLESRQQWNQDDIILGWARRIVSYKRPFAALEDLARVKKLVNNAGKNIRFVFSGTLHPSDSEGAKMYEDFRKIIDNELAGFAFFMSEYNMDSAKLLISGCDVWMNTPIVGFEACGTSGMKAALNGVLPLSTRDGWMDEVNFYGIGWELDNENVNASILDRIEKDIQPLFTKRVNGKPENWITNMKSARELIKKEFTTTRMLREYTEKLYLPLLP